MDDWGMVGEDAGRSGDNTTLESKFIINTRIIMIMQSYKSSKYQLMEEYIPMSCVKIIGFHSTSVTDNSKSVTKKGIDLALKKWLTPRA